MQRWIVIRYMQSAPERIEIEVGQRDGTERDHADEVDSGRAADLHSDLPDVVEQRGVLPRCQDVPPVDRRACQHQEASAIRGTALVMLGAGILVLTGAVAAGRGEAYLRGGAAEDAGRQAARHRLRLSLGTRLARAGLRAGRDRHGVGDRAPPRAAARLWGSWQALGAKVAPYRRNE